MTVRNKEYNEDTAKAMADFGLPYYSHYLVPCGKCPQCLQRRADNWTLRLKWELKRSCNAHFVTLTYAIPPRTYNDLATCKKSDLQNYFKRLRKTQQGNAEPLKYYAVSEYGTKFQRPHYHIILLNVLDERNIVKAWTLNNQIIGQVDIGTVTDDSINYVTSYIGKKIGLPLFDYDDRLPEFSLMSKHLGDNYVKHMSSWHINNQYGFTSLDRGKMPLPRYYSNKIFTNEHSNIKSIVKLKNYEYFEKSKLAFEILANQNANLRHDIANYHAEAWRLHQSYRQLITSDL